MRRLLDYSEILKIELEGWCYGIANYPGEINASLIHRIIEELRPTLLKAMEFGIPVNFVKLASKLAKAAKYLVDEREITLSLLMNLPNPEYVDEFERNYITRAIDEAAKVFPDIWELLELKWTLDEESTDEDTQA
ncbi:MAG: hypothetical protein NZO16_03130 [Deltaproteobacteria bacterium]|nr:hypothetical protein [Deltaproteobacteria bacterium]